MAFFKFRKGADESPKVAAQPQNIELIRQRAKFRLAGATVLVLAGVIGLPMLFDKQPRPIAVDTPITIPDKNKLPPLAIPDTPAAPAVPDKAPSQPAVAAASDSSKLAATVVKEEKQPDEKKTPVPEDTAKNAVKATVKPEASRAQALLDGKDLPPKIAAKTPAVVAAAPVQPVAADTRFIVQVGAYADNARAHDVRLKLESAGIKTYAQAVDTKDGKRIRVRVGPFVTRAEADKVSEKVKKLSLPAAVLTL